MDQSRNAANIFNKLAETYQNKFMDVSLYWDTFDQFCNLILSKNAEILELACGPGNITKYLLNRRPDFKLLGIDLAPNMIRLAKQNNPKAEFKVMDCRNISVFEKRYDAIMIGFCLPYLSEPEALRLIKDANRLLKSKGIIYLSTMEDKYDKSGFKKGSSGDEIYMYYHSADFLLNCLKISGLNLISESRKEYLSSEGAKVADLILIAQK